MRAGLWCLVLAVCCVAAPARAAQESDEIPLRLRALDVSADTLPAGKGEFHLGWLAYHHALFDGFQLSTHGLAWLGTVANLTARVQVIDRPELRLTAQAAGYWLLPTALVPRMLDLPEGVGFHLINVPTELRASIPLGARVELNVATHHTLLWMISGDGSSSGFYFGAEAGVALYDQAGSWLLVGTLPLFSRQSLSASFEGVRVLDASLTLDDRSAWTVMAARDHVFGRNTHLRLGLGWRGQPGIIVLDGIGPLMIQLDLYWR